jgi:hypothetical protein
MKKILGPPVEDGMKGAVPATASEERSSKDLVQQESSPNQAAVDSRRQRTTRFHPVLTDISQVIVPSITVGAGAGKAYPQRCVCCGSVV